MIWLLPAVGSVPPFWSLLEVVWPVKMTSVAEPGVPRVKSKVQTLAAPGAMMAGRTGEQLRLEMVPIFAAGTQVAARAETGPAFVQLRVRPV